MKKRILKLMGAILACLLAVMPQATAFADEVAEGDASGLKIIFVVQNGELYEGGIPREELPEDTDFTVMVQDERSWKYMAEDNYMLKRYTNGHLDFAIDRDLYSLACGPIHDSFFHFFCDKRFRDQDIELRFTNWTLKFDGTYEDMHLDDVTATVSPDSKVFDYDIKSLLPEGDAGADMIRHMLGFSFDYSFVRCSFSEVPEDYEEFILIGEPAPEPPVTEPDTEPVTEPDTEPVTEPDTEPVETEPVTEAQTDAPETDAPETDAPETDDPSQEDTTAEVTDEQTEAAVKDDATAGEEPSSAAQATEKTAEKEGGSNVKAIVTIVVAVILLLALVAVGIAYKKKIKM